MKYTAIDASTGRLKEIIVASFISLLFFTPPSAEARVSLSDLQNQITELQAFQNAQKDTMCAEGSVMYGIDADGSIICIELVPPPSEQERLHVFVTSTTHNGNYEGVAGADAICQQLADQSSLPLGDYKAWISGSTPLSAPIHRFTGFPHNLPYVLADGETIIAMNSADLLDGILINPINQYETSDPVEPPTHVWTNTTTEGELYDGSFGYSCAGWTNAQGIWLPFESPDNEGEVNILFTQTTGTTSNINNWSTLQTDILCDINNRLYCFEQKNEVEDQ